MKDKIKGIFSINSHINAKLYTLLSAKSLRDMKVICAEAEQDNSIADISWLKKFRKDVEYGRKPFYTTDCNFSNSHIYGIWHSLFGDMGVKPLYTPSVEHGLIFHDQVFNDVMDTSRAACVTFGQFRKNIIRKYIDIPVFCVGPYIHYAKPFYPEDKIAAEKNKNGKTLLVFPTHSVDKSVLTVQIESYISYLRAKQNDYDTIIINVFWWNINDPLVDALQAEGYRIVSAGFRDDIMFMRRLKTIIQLSDYVVSDSIGTHTGYCLHCGVPFSYEPLGSVNCMKSGKELSDLDFVKAHTDLIAQAFLRADKITEEQKELCRYYWGEDCVKSERELRLIAEITAAIMRRSGGWHSRIRSQAMSMLSELSSESTHLLAEAVL